MSTDTLARMAASHELFARIRIEIFDAESLSEFGKRLGFDKSQIYRLETGENPLRPKHVELCRPLPRVPSNRRARFEELIQQLADAVAQEEQVRIEAKKVKALKTQQARQAQPQAAPPARDDDAARAAWMVALELLLLAELIQQHQAHQAAWNTASQLLVAAGFARRYQRRRRWIWATAASSAALALCVVVVLLVRVLSTGKTVEVYVISQTPLEETWIPPREMGGGTTVRVHRLIPPKPFKGQKVTPCDRNYGEQAINGGCWYGGRDPGGEPCAQYEYEDSHGKCYRPVKEDPEQPLSSLPPEEHPSSALPAAPASRSVRMGLLCLPP